MSRRDKLLGDLYQIAGHRLLAEDSLTAGQRERLTELLLDVLSEPDRFSAGVLRKLYRMAMKP